jgi:hypothetical protein
VIEFGGRRLYRSKRLHRNITQSCILETKFIPSSKSVPMSVMDMIERYGSIKTAPLVLPISASSLFVVLN